MQLQLHPNTCDAILNTSCNKIQAFNKLVFCKYLFPSNLFSSLVSQERPINLFIYLPPPKARQWHPAKHPLNTADGRALDFAAQKVALFAEKKTAQNSWRWQLCFFYFSAAHDRTGDRSPGQAQRYLRAIRFVSTVENFKVQLGIQQDQLPASPFLCCTPNVYQDTPLKAFDCSRC